MKRFAWAIMLVLASSNGHAGDMAGADAFAAGATYGTDNAGVTSGKINSTNATDLIPGYTGTAPSAADGLDATGLYGGGKNNLLVPGVTRNTTCLAMTGNTDQKEQAACDAVKVMNDANPNPYSFAKADPLLSRATSVYADPVTVLTDKGMSIPISETACTTEVVNIPPETRTEVCQEYLTEAPVTCSLTRVVEVDKDYLYQCTTATSRINTYPCSKTLTVTVTIDQTCVPTTWYAAGSVYAAVVDAYCDPTNTNTIRLRFTPSGLSGVCLIGYADMPITPFVISTANEATSWWTNTCDIYGNCTNTFHVRPAITLAINHWKGACTVGSAIGYMAGTHGCVGNTCTYYLRSWDVGWGSAISGDHVTSSGPRWGHIFGTTHSFAKPNRTVNTSDSWDDQCVALEAKSQ